MPTRTVIREVNLFAAVRAFTPEGKRPSLDHIPDSELDRWCELPITHVWGMGAWQRSPKGRTVSIEHAGLRADYSAALPDWTEEDVTGSPYAVFGYEPSDRLGSLRAFIRFRQRLSERGIGLILDFIPNHFAIDHPWVASHSERFVMRADVSPDATPPPGWFSAKTRQGTRWFAHGRDPYFPAWTDTAQLDYRKPETRKAMVGELLKISDLCDGVRCDMAMLVLNNIFRKTWGNENPSPHEYWVEAIDAVRAIKPSFLFLAECYWGTENHLLELGFDLVYDKDFSTRAIELKINDLRSTLSERRTWGQRYVRFLENHDEKRIAAQVPPERLPVLTGLLWLQPGHILWHEGEEYGAKIKMPVQLDRRPVEEQVPSIVNCLERNKKMLNDFPFAYGSAQLVAVNPTGVDDTTFSALIPILWTAGNRRLLWIGNLSSQPACARIPLHLIGMAGRKVSLYDYVAETEFLRDGDELLGLGLFVMLPPNGMHWFEVKVVTG